MQLPDGEGAKEEIHPALQIHALHVGRRSRGLGRQELGQGTTATRTRGKIPPDPRSSRATGHGDTRPPVWMTLVRTPPLMPPQHRGLTHKLGVPRDERNRVRGSAAPSALVT